jgi:oligoribonuclease
VADQRFFWLDLEMTGLDPHRDRILEAAAVITDETFETMDSFETPVYQSPAVLEHMGEWCQKHHGASGLLDRVPHGMTESELDRRLCSLAELHLTPKPVILCGNSIHQDRRFIENYLPGFASMLHYRMVDVSSFKVIFRDVLGLRFEKHNTHRALDDIQESIAELRYYLSAVRPGEIGSTGTSTPELAGLFGQTPRPQTPPE